MKRIFSVLLILGFLTFSLSAQVKNLRALGLHLGNVTEVSYQHPMSDDTRLEFNLGLSSWANQFTGLSGLYQKVWDLSDLADGVNWYAGAGVGVGSKAGGFAMSIMGQVGIEYDLMEATDLPIQLSLDYRPDFLLIPNAETRFDIVGLGVRYKF